MRHLSIVILVFILVLIFQSWVAAQTVLKGSVIGKGGAPMEGGGIRVNGTIGQVAIGVSSGASNSALAGFWYIATPPPIQTPAIGFSPAGFVFNAPSGGPNPASKKLSITNAGGGTLSWSVSDNAGWLTLSPTSGSCTTEIDEVTVSVNVSGLADGVYDANITITAPEASNTPQIAPVKLAIGPVLVYQRQLKDGWNHISFFINRCFYNGFVPTDQPDCVEKVDIINTLGKSSLADWFSSVLTPSDSWEMVIGQNGAMASNLPPAFHSLKYMSPISGYWVKIKSGTGVATLSITGPSYDPDCAIRLVVGWNQIGFPLDKGYHDTPNPPTNMPWVTNWQKVEPPAAGYVFKSIQGKYDMVIGEYGAYNPSLPVDFSSLRHIASGCGYWIKLKQDVNLKYSDMGISTIK